MDGCHISMESSYFERTEWAQTSIATVGAWKWWHMTVIQIILVATTFHGAGWSHISDNSDRLVGHKVSRPTLGPTQAFIQWELGALAGIVQAWCATVVSPSGTEVKNVWSYATMAFSFWGVMAFSQMGIICKTLHPKRTVILVAFQLRCDILSSYNLFQNFLMDRV